VLGLGLAILDYIGYLTKLFKKQSMAGTWKKLSFESMGKVVAALWHCGMRNGVVLVRITAYKKKCVLMPGEKVSLADYTLSFLALGHSLVRIILAQKVGLVVRENDQ